MSSASRILFYASSPAVEGSRKWLIENEVFCGLLFVALALIGFTVFCFLRTNRAFYIELTYWNLLHPPKFLGLENYSRLMGDKKFWGKLLCG
jgi:multiple sugar transport system permease protein